MWSARVPIGGRRTGNVCIGGGGEGKWEEKWWRREKLESEVKWENAER
jgi:hypothetical protein